MVSYMSSRVGNTIASAWLALVLLVLLSACASTKVPPQDQPIAISLNQKRVDPEKGLRIAQVRKNPRPYLSLEINDSTTVQKLAESNTLQIMLARGSRPVTSLQTEYDIPYRMGFATDSLLNQAEAGDRLIFYAEDFILYTLDINR